MSKLLFVVVIITSVAGPALAQTEKRVNEIRAAVAAINKGSVKYKKTTKTVMGISTEGAEATLYHQGKELKKVAAKIYGETFRGTSEFYFVAGELIFEYDRISHYNHSIGLKSQPKVVRIEEIRSYFYKGKMIKLLNGAKAVAAGTDEWNDAEKGAQETVKSIMEAGND